jgi:hypothetical protein
VQNSAIKISQLVLPLLILLGGLRGQIAFPADPLDRLAYEIALFRISETPVIPLMTPAFLINNGPSRFQVVFHSEVAYNSGAANLENMSDRWIGKGWSYFRSFNISRTGKYYAFSIEPFFFVNQNLKYLEPDRPEAYSRLNDNRYHDQLPLVKLNFRETQLFLHYRGLGGGISNASMWWGAGLQSSLLMTNNTVQFPYLVLGTVHEQRIRNVGLNMQFFFSQLDDKNLAKPYFTALNLDATFYSVPIVTVGLSRLFVTPEKNISWKSALVQPFQVFYRSQLRTEDRPGGWSPDDQMIIGFLRAVFPEAKMTLFFELGRGDHAENWTDLRRHPDHSVATIFGFRKVGLFDNDRLLLGFEYQNNVLPEKYYHLRDLSRVSKISFQDKPSLDFNSYDGRHWAMHSGPDSDDLLLYTGYTTDSWTLIPMLNYERRGVLAAPQGIPEIKVELKLHFQYKFRDFLIKSLVEFERFDNYSFSERKVSNLVVLVGIEKAL